MDDYLRNTLFASELLEFLFQQISIPWEAPHASILEDDLYTTFDNEIAVAVYTIWTKNFRDVLDCYYELDKKDKDIKENEAVQKYEEDASYKKAYRFGHYAISAADSYFSKGYSPGSFLGYCAIVLGVATYYFRYPSNQVPEMAAEVVALVLLAHQLTGQFYKHNGWEGLHEISYLFNRLPENADVVERPPGFTFW
ncbi:hypothetical protein HNY73_008712 [Argiope bruennichi]|uniref:Uncharacterized protein n=1 Tax=Argiope bruennichi TaxID=94029 RepID=A0A8T0F897_ARGBR|nr:hypothetical protein HNY73_008712 [Argiope bruennichi]